MNYTLYKIVNDSGFIKKKETIQLFSSIIKFDLNLIILFLEIGEKKFGLKKITERYYQFLKYDGLIVPYTYLKRDKSTKGIVDGSLFDNHRSTMLYHNPTRFSLFLRSVWTLWEKIKNYISKEQVIPLAFLNEINYRTSGNILRNNVALNRRELSQINFLIHSNFKILESFMSCLNDHFATMYENKTLFLFDHSIHKESLNIKNLSQYKNDEKNGKFICFKNIFEKINSYR